LLVSSQHVDWQIFVQFQFDCDMVADDFSKYFSEKKTQSPQT